jgi:hypothetical protein
MHEEPHNLYLTPDRIRMRVGRHVAQIGEKYM